jgi:hypothetical protein
MLKQARRASDLELPKSNMVVSFSVFGFERTLANARMKLGDSVSSESPDYTTRHRWTIDKKARQLNTFRAQNAANFSFASQRYASIAPYLIL